MEPLDAAEAWHREGRKVALATVMSTWGSSPLPPGSQLAVDGQGAFVGSVSGGCIEGAVIEEARKVIEEGKARTLRFGVTNDRAWEVGLSCGGEIEILVESLASAFPLYDRLQKLRRASRPAAVVTRLSDGARSLVHEAGVEGEVVLAGDLQRRIMDLAWSDRSGRIGDDLFARVYTRPVRLVLVGAVHIAQALVHVVRPLGFEVVVIDPRGAFATEERFPGVKLITEWPDKAMASLCPDRRTAVVTLTHDPKLDDPALKAAFASEAFFIGCLGSRRTHAARLERLRGEGIPDEALARIHAPVGLPLGGRRPAEIALAVAAEIVKVLHGDGAA